MTPSRLDLIKVALGKMELFSLAKGVLISHRTCKESRQSGCKRSAKWLEVGRIRDLDGIIPSVVDEQRGENPDLKLKS